MKTDFRTLCAELVDLLQDRKDLECGWPGEDPEQDLIDRARAALAQPEPEGLTDEEILKMAADALGYESIGPEDYAVEAYRASHAPVEAYGSELIAFARAAIAADRARWGRPTPQPATEESSVAQPPLGEVAELVEWLKLQIDRHTHWAQEHDRTQLRRLIALLEPQPPADGEVAELVVDGEVARFAEWLQSHSEQALELGRPDWAHMLTRAADLLERLAHYEQALSAVMPSDFKDWWENSRAEWPDVAAGVITSLRRQEQLAWEKLEQHSTPQPVPVSERLPGPGEVQA